MSSASYIAHVCKRCQSISYDLKVFTLQYYLNPLLIIYSSLNKVPILSLLKIGHFLFREKHMSMKLCSSQQRSAWYVAIIKLIRDCSKCGQVIRSGSCLNYKPYVAVSNMFLLQNQSMGVLLNRWEDSS